MFDVFSNAINEAYEDYPLSYSRSVVHSDRLSHGLEQPMEPIQQRQKIIFVENLNFLGCGAIITCIFWETITKTCPYDIQ